MTERPDPDRTDSADGADGALLRDLSRVTATADAPPDLLAAGARAAFGLGRLDDELARLVQDTSTEPVGARGAAQVRHLAFASEEVTVDVELTPDAGGHHLMGLVSGPVDRLAAQTPGTTYPIDLDEHGRFRAAGLSGLLLRFTLTTRSGRGVTTPWVRLATP